jgi:competence protein ComEC
VAFLNVGQGDSIFIQAPNGKQILIDAGADSKAILELGKILPFYDKSIDILIETHSDADHVGGVPDLLNRFHIKKFIFNGKADTDGLNSEIKKILDKQKIDQITVSAGDRIILDEEKNIYIDILWPQSGITLEDNNDYSVITRLVWNNAEFLLTGDAPQEIENKISDTFNVSSDVLKAGHHGSKYSSSQYFIEKVNPQYAIISAGKDNKFGHPHQEVLDTISKTNAKILQTIEMGTILFETDGEKIWLKD